MTQIRTIGFTIGIILGLGAPVGALVIKGLFSEGVTFRWIVDEIADQFYYYAYMTLITPVVFAFFGAYLGKIDDEAETKNESIRQEKNILEAQSMTDDVTGLYNHRHILEEIEKEIERSKRHDHPLSALMVDVDNFKSANDLYGHRTGDLVLREIASVLNQSIRRIDILGRYGGDEFIVILPEARVEAAKVVAERILQNMRQHRFQTKRDYISSTVSIGVFSFNDVKNIDVNQFIEKIDDVMFKAKALGKDRMFINE